MKRALPILFLEDLLLLASIGEGGFGCYVRRMSERWAETVKVPWRLAVIAEYHWHWIGYMGESALVADRKSIWIFDQLASVDYLDV
jgi:hypothetical protein